MFNPPNYFIENRWKVSSSFNFITSLTHLSFAVSPRDMRLFRDHLSGYNVGRCTRKYKQLFLSLFLSLAENRERVGGSSLTLTCIYIRIIGYAHFMLINIQCADIMHFAYTRPDMEVKIGKGSAIK